MTICRDTCHIWGSTSVTNITLMSLKAKQLTIIKSCTSRAYNRPWRTMKRSGMIVIRQCGPGSKDFKETQLVLSLLFR